VKFDNSYWVVHAKNTCRLILSTPQKDTWKIRFMHQRLLRWRFPAAYTQDSRDAHGYLDIRINPDNLFSGYQNIRLINHQYGCFFMYFLVQFFKIFMLVSKIMYINASISEILLAELEPATIWLCYNSATETLGYQPLPRYELIWLQSYFSKIIEPEKKPHWYPNIYPDNLVSAKRISG